MGKDNGRQNQRQAKVCNPRLSGLQYPYAAPVGKVMM
jgi:hypothetical protein